MVITIDFFSYYGNYHGKIPFFFFPFFLGSEFYFFQFYLKILKGNYHNIFSQYHSL